MSVVVPTRDRRSLLSQTVAHVLAQRAIDLELIVVDDGSRDGTSDWVRTLDDARISLLQGEGQGVAAARNLGLSEARADLVAFNDDDDLWAPHKLATQVAALRSDRSARWICSGAVRVNAALEIIATERVWAQGDVSTTGLVANPVPGGASGVVAETGLVRDVGGFDERFHVLADWDLWIRLGLRSEMGAIDRPLHAYRVHAGGMSGSVAATRAEIALLEDKYRAERAERSVSLNLPRLEHWMGDRAQRSGHRVDASRAFLRSAGINGRSRKLVRAAEALVWSGGIQRRDHRRGQRVDVAWLAETAAWLPVPAGRPVGPDGG